MSSDVKERLDSEQVTILPHLHQERQGDMTLAQAVSAQCYLVGLLSMYTRRFLDNRRREVQAGRSTRPYSPNTTPHLLLCIASALINGLSVK